MLNSNRKMPLIGSVSYVGSKTGCAPMSKDKQNTAEMPHELRGWHARRKYDHDDYVGIQKIVWQLKIFDPKGIKGNEGASSRVSRRYATLGADLEPDGPGLIGKESFELYETR